CVNTPSDSSRRYVNPIGRGSAASGHGMISIPGATVGFENIAGVIARSPVHVPRMPAGAKEQLFLRWGYDAPDPANDYQITAGELDQCLGLEPAWVEVDITHRSSPPTLACPPKPLDLHWTAVDPNLLPLNPIWGEQCRLGHSTPTAAMSLCDNFKVNPAFSTPWAPACTSHLLTANYCHQPPWPLCSPDFPFPSSTLRGHANFGFATVTGKLRYLNHLGGLGGDDDFSFDLLSGQGLVTPQNHVYEGIRALIIEFDKGETVDRIRDFGGSFWTRFSGLDEAGRGALTFNLPAQVIGLVGIDAIHGFSELHPVVGLAIQYRRYGPDNADTWAIFARRAGDEGGCSGAGRSCGQARALGGPANIDSGLDEMRFMLPRTYKEATYWIRGFSNATVDTSF